MTVLLAFVMVAALGTWIPLAQFLPGTPERSRVFYVAVGNVVFAGIALLASGAGLWVRLAELLAAAGGRRGVDGGQLLRFQGVGDDRARAGGRDVDAAQHRCRVRLGRLAVR